MLNAWDIGFIFTLILAAWIGWRLKSLLLLGLGFAFALAPMAAQQWQHALADCLVQNLGGKGLQGQQDKVAYWLIFSVGALLIFLAFRALSGLLKALQLEGLDRAFGAFMTLAMLLAALSLNLQSWSSHLDPGSGSKLRSSYTWAHLHPESSQAWAAKVEQSLPDLSKIAPGTSGHSRKKAAHR